MRQPEQPVVVQLPPKQEPSARPEPKPVPEGKKKPVSLTVQITPTRGEDDDDE